MHEDEPEGPRWPDDPTQPCEPGWARVLTPLCACLDVVINSAIWDVCTEWQLLQSGRGLLSPTNPLQWFDEGELEHVPRGLLAELLASALLMDDFYRVVAEDAEARAHISRLPDYVYGAEVEEWELIDKCLDVVRLLDAREMARAAAREAQTE